MIEKPAYSINELAAAGPPGRSTIFKAIKDGELIARKAGRRTIILKSDYEAYLAGLPKAGPLGKAA